MSERLGHWTFVCLSESNDFVVRAIVRVEVLSLIELLLWSHAKAKDRANWIVVG